MNLKELYDKTKLFILNNYKGKLEEETLDILTVSIMSLFIRFPEVTKEKLPNVLDKIEIFFENKSILDMVSKRYPEFPKHEITDTTNAFVTRALSLGEDNKFTEEWSMYISTSDIKNKTVNIVSKSVHELIHLLRFNGIIDNDNEAKIRDGVSIARVNKLTKIPKRKHYNFEEGVVEDFTIKAMESLYDFIKNEDVSFSPALSSFKTNFKRDFKPSYELERFFLEGLNKNKQFSDLLEYSFVDKNEPLSVITYYNNAIGDPSGFTRLSRGLDTVVEFADNEDIENLKKASSQLIEQINVFLMKKKR